MRVLSTLGSGLLLILSTRYVPYLVKQCMIFILHNSVLLISYAIYFSLVLHFGKIFDLLLLLYSRSQFNFSFSFA